LTDPRAGDVAAVERLLDQASAEGIARLPVLSAAELWVLCGEQQVLADEAEVRWWRSKSGADREKYATAMVDFLIDRKLVRRPDDSISPEGRPPAPPGAGAKNPTTEMPMTAELAMIVAARQAPSVVVVCTRADGSADQAPRMYGLAEVGRSPRAVVSEVVFPAKQAAFGPMHHYSLASPERAGAILSKWAAAQDKSGLLSRKPKPSHRVIDVYRNRSGEELTRDRLKVSVTADAFELTRQRSAGAPEPPISVSAAELTDLLTTLMLEPAA
jgi:hypothetical protein